MAVHRKPARARADSGKHSPAVCLEDFERLAHRRVSKAAWEYLSGGAGDELTLRWNRTAFDAIRLKPRVLCDVSKLDTTLNLFGQEFPHPILLAPAAYHKLIHPGGECATARGAGAGGTTLVVSTFATTSLEEVAKQATAPLWFQLYMMPERSISKDLIQRAEAAGYRALCITVDTPVLGVRNREMRINFQLPRGMVRENVKNVSPQVAAAAHFSKGGPSIAVLNPRLTWNDVEWVKSLTKLPVLLKGILAPEDAQLAVEHGASGIIVSNHGARNLDTAPAAVDALPGIVKAAGGKIPVLMDGGIRRGTDVLKALALGARAVLLGRPYLWGLAVDGPAGVERVVRILLDEFRAAMALCGKPSLAGLDRSLLWPES
jgi:4-hydroxymandelate oxidase